MKKFTVALTLIALFISTTFICGAKSAENLIKDEEKNSKAELKQIQELIDYDSEFLTSMMPSLNASVDKNQIKKSMKTDNAYKQYRLNSVYIYDDYTKNGNFGSMISDGYNWIVPLYDENIYISFSKKSESWQFGVKIVYDVLINDIARFRAAVFPLPTTTEISSIWIFP